MNSPPPQNPFTPPQYPAPAPPQAPGAGPPQPPPEILGGLIPRNRDALISYYCGIFALIPCVGIVLGAVAVVFGIMGLKAAAREPYRKGKVHAWVGIVCGGLFGFLYLAGCVLWLVALAATKHR
jgi:hypothetical protein